MNEKTISVIKPLIIKRHKTKVGVPTKYNSDVPKQVFSMVNSCKDIEDEFHKTRGDKNNSYDRLVKVNLPTEEKVCLMFQIDEQTIQNWEATYPKFKMAMDFLRKRQADILLEKGLSGDYNPMIAKLILGKRGYRDSSNVDLNITLPKPLLDHAIDESDHSK